MSADCAGACMKPSAGVHDAAAHAAPHALGAKILVVARLAMRCPSVLQPAACCQRAVAHRAAQAAAVPVSARPGRSLSLIHLLGAARAGRRSRRGRSGARLRRGSCCGGGSLHGAEFGCGARRQQRNGTKRKAQAHAYLQCRAPSRAAAAAASGLASPGTWLRECGNGSESATRRWAAMRRSAHLRAPLQLAASTETQLAAAPPLQQAVTPQASARAARPAPGPQQRAQEARARQGLPLRPAREAQQAACHRQSLHRHQSRATAPRACRFRPRLWPQPTPAAWLRVQPAKPWAAARRPLPRAARRSACSAARRRAPAAGPAPRG